MKILAKMFYVVISRSLRLDKGTETGTMATIHCYLRNGHNDVEKSRKHSIVWIIH